MMVTGSASAEVPFRDSPQAKSQRYRRKQMLHGACGHSLSRPSRNVASPQQIERRGTILHHGGEFGGSLPRVQRHDDKAFGHGSKIHCDPAHTIVGIKGATIALASAPGGKGTRANDRICSSSSLPVEAMMRPSRISCSTAVSACFCRLAKMSSRKLIRLLCRKEASTSI